MSDHIGKFVSAMGVELEGGWYGPAYNKLLASRSLVRIVGDGSVHCFDAPDRDNLFQTEIIPQSPFTNFTALSDWMTTFYPDYVPRAWSDKDMCGLHIHISLRTRRMYQNLMCRKFFDDTYNFWVEWGKQQAIPQDKPFWHRINGESLFCQKMYLPDKQAKVSFKSADLRYAGLNYCFGCHGTIELRLLPMFDTAAESVVAVRAWLDFVEGWLKAYKVPTEALTQVLDVTEMVQGIVLESTLELTEELDGPEITSSLGATLDLPDCELGSQEVQLCV